MTKSILAFILLSFFIVSGLNAQSQKVTLGASKDNTLYEDNDGAVSNGSGVHFFVGSTNTGSVRRAVIHFDISQSVPADSEIDSVRLTLHMSKSRAGNQTITVHELENSWGEGSSDAGSNEGSGTASADGDATWIHRFYDDSLWSNVGGDFDDTPSASAVVGGIGSYSWMSSEMAQDVNDWYEHPERNHGWLLKGDESTNVTTKRFDSHENATVSQRPQLEVWYSPATSIEKPQQILPREIAVQANYPNPFNPSTSIPLRLQKTFQNIQIHIYDSAGELVKTLHSGGLAAGEYTFTWDGSNHAQVQVASGVYYLQVTGNGFNEMQKMVLIR